MKTIKLDDYFIQIGADEEFWNVFNAFAAKTTFSRKIIVVDENTARDCLPLFQEKTGQTDWPIIQIPSGEKNKTLDSCQTIWQKMMELQLDRSTLVVNLGGGVIGDMAGFCAATYKRGLYFVQMPTTLLSQVDASIGGKLGIDFRTLKNTIGLFKNPEAVFVCPSFLKTLPFEELRSGFSEIIKHALIGDKVLWDDLQDLDIKSSNIDWAEWIHRSLLVKQEVVAQDPFERGLRKTLNFGHTIGHALESHALHTENPLLHGEAIAIGMICESWIAMAQKRLSKEDFEEMVPYLLRQVPDWKIPVEELPQLLDLMRQDKKNEGATINFSMVPQLGAAVFNITAPVPLIGESLQRYNELRCV